MVLLVPISPEVPRQHVPRLWPALIMMLFLGVSFHFARAIIDADLDYVGQMAQYMIQDESGNTQLTVDGQLYLSKRPLLMLASSKGDWGVDRLILSNFVHGSLGHLLLNLIGVFAGARICATYLSFLAVLSVFLLGGSLGLAASIFLSSEISPYIPHVGASGGIFALMGCYYVFNFRYRTRYFFWFPSRQGLISLRTSWFFFVDVVLLELILTAAQLLPHRIDTVDHIAHVVGFLSGLTLAVILRTLMGWPSFIQTRLEYSRWRLMRKSKSPELLVTALETWLSLLKINPYNDSAKVRLCELYSKHASAFPIDTADRVFEFLSPTFVRLHPTSVVESIASALKSYPDLPRHWLSQMPYDSIIRIAQAMALAPAQQAAIFPLVSQYRLAHPEGGDVERKLELLLLKLKSLFPSPSTNELQNDLKSRG